MGFKLSIISIAALLLLLLTFTALSVSAQITTTFWGNVSVGGKPGNGSAIDVFVGGNSSPSVSFIVAVDCIWFMND